MKSKVEKELKISSCDALTLENLILKRNSMLAQAKQFEAQINEHAKKVYASFGLKLEEWNLNLQERTFVKRIK